MGLDLAPKRNYRSVSQLHGDPGIQVLGQLFQEYPGRGQLPLRPTMSSKHK